MTQATTHTPRMTTTQKFSLMALVQSEYASAGLYDSAFAAHATERLGFTVGAQTVKNYRQQFGIAQTLRIKAPTTEDLLARIAELEAKLADAQAAVRGDESLYGPVTA